MTFVIKRMTRDEMFRLYPRKWLALGDADAGFFRKSSNTGNLGAILLAVCDTQKEAISVPFKGENYKVNGRGVCNSLHWEKEWDDNYDDWFMYDIGATH